MKYNHSNIKDNLEDNIKHNIKQNKENKLEYDFLDIQLNMIEQHYKKNSLYLDINNQYLEKYKISHYELLKKRYYEDSEILNFYNQYFNELEKLEKIGMCIWKLFGELWNEEKQNLILQILSLILLIEKQSLKIKTMILKISKNKSKMKTQIDLKFKEDRVYFLNLLNINKDYYINNIDFIDIESNFSDLEKIQLKKKEESRKELIKEFDRIYCDVKL